MSKSKPNIFNIKKCQKKEAKKRKLEAFLNLVREDESNSVNLNSKQPKTFEESYKALKNELKKYQKKKEVEPSFYLAESGRDALLKFVKDDVTPSCTSPLFIEDIYHLLMKSVIGNYSDCPIRWAKLERPGSISKTVVVEIDGLSNQNIIDLCTSFSENFLLPTIVDAVSTGTSFVTEISTMHKTNDSVERNYSSMFPVHCESAITSQVANQQNTISKLHLLLSPIQLAMEHYPLPQSIFAQSESVGYCFTKEAYTPVKSDSPMFAIDCEMCRTRTGKQEVTRVAIVDEDLKTVYHTLVKPKAEIVDYITRFSGITEKMLRNVTTTLSDVQKDLRELLPSDAILCGQSLNCDLHALKMIHPYIIDTSVIYNTNGIRQRKSSLKHLARIHLKETIQDSKKGHNPIEDSIATMKLVQLKLKKSVEYGDAVLLPDTDENNGNEIGNNKLDSENSTNVLNSNSVIKDNGLFSLLSKFSKKTCLVGDENYLSNCPELVSGNVCQVSNSSVKETAKATVENLEKNDLIISHLDFDTENSSITELKSKLKELYDCCPKNTLLIILMPNVNRLSNECFTHNFCTITLKT